MLLSSKEISERRSLLLGVDLENDVDQVYSENLHNQKETAIAIVLFL